MFRNSSKAKGYIKMTLGYFFEFNQKITKMKKQNLDMVNHVMLTN